MTRLGLAFALMIVWFAGTAWAAEEPRVPVTLDASTDVLELKPDLQPYTLPQAKPQPGKWFSVTLLNSGSRPASRILQAGEPRSRGFSLLPRPQRPTILQVVSTNPGVVVESTNAYGRKGFRIAIPATTKAAIAVRMVGADDPPSLLAWTEEGLGAHNRQIWTFLAAVAGLIAAAMVIAGGLAVMTHHWAPRWAAVSLLCLLLTRLAEMRLFDGSIVTSVGGPYGLTALFGGMALAAGIRFVDLVVPVREIWRGADRWLPRIQLGVLGVAGLAYVGLPGATLLTDIVLFAFPLVLFFYLIQRHRQGSKPALVLQPAAGLFAMVSIASGFAALGGFGTTVLVPDLAGGFAAAGSIMLLLAVTAGEGISVIPWRHLGHLPHLPHLYAAPQPVRAPPPLKADPTPHPAIEAIGASRQGVFELDLRKEVTILSADAGDLLGLPATRMTHKLWTERVHRDDRPVYQQAITEFRKQSGLAFRIEFRARGEDGRYPWFELRATMKGPDGQPAERCVGLLADVTTRKEAETEMLDRTVRDPLTGLGNRVALMEELEGLGEGLRDLLFAMLDIDRFKSIHASLGDTGGDAVLSGLAQRLFARYGEAARVFRIGGDGFAVLMPAATAAPQSLGDEIAALCRPAHEVDGRTVFATASVGVALGSDARDPIDLIKNAELAMMQAKRGGGDCARLYAPEMEAAAPQDSVALEADLRQALERGEFEVFFQPIIRLADRSVAGFEALLRWRHPEKGLIAPVDFIAHSEESGLIVELGLLALGQAAKYLALWQRYFPLAEALFVSVNLSQRQMCDGEFESRLGQIVAQSGLAPGSFKLEITESTVAGDGDILALASRIKALGVGLAIDDFGTGLSNLSRFADLPFDAVKVDKSFLDAPGGTSGNGGVVLASVVKLAHELERCVIVEGVESEIEADRVAQLGCDMAQGYLFGEPMSAHEALTYIARHFRTPGRNAAHPEPEDGSGTPGVGTEA